MSVTHLAGPPVVLGGRGVQRCAICGQKLLDSLNVMVPLDADGTAGTFPMWRLGGLVRWSGHNPRHEVVVGHFDDDKPLPDDLCWSLIEE